MDSDGSSEVNSSENNENAACSKVNLQKDQKNKNFKEFATIKKSKLYVPPNIIPKKCDEEDDSHALKRQKAMERAKRKALSSDIIAELKTEFDEGPEEIIEKNIYRRKPNKKLEEKKKYEEEYMIRLRNTKRHKKSDFKQELMTISSLTSHVTNFDDISFFDQNNFKNFNILKKKIKCPKKNKRKEKKINF